MCCAFKAFCLWADFKTDRPEAGLIVLHVLALILTVLSLHCVLLISTTAHTVWDFRH